MSISTSSQSDRRDSIGGLAFVALWSTGYIAAAFGLHDSGPFTLAVARFVGTVVLIGAWLAIQRPVALPVRRQVMHALAAGVLLQGGFFGFTYAGMRAGVPAAAAGLICGLMPLVTALIAAMFLREPLRRSAAIGLALGLSGVMLVVWPDLQGPSTAVGYVFLFLALITLSAGTVYQKRFVTGLDPRLSLVVQVTGALLAILPFAWWLEGFRVTPSPEFFGAVAWVVIVNSCSGLLLYLWLISRGAAGKVASLFYLVPPVTALLAALILGARFTALDAVGFGLAAAGVWMGQRA